jgi:hypothetical protein
MFVNHYFRNFILDYYPEVLFSHWFRKQRLIWEVISDICWRCYLFNCLFREFIPKKEIFKFTKPICPCTPSNLYRHILRATTLWILYSKPWGFGFKTRGLRDTCHQWLIFQICYKIRIERLKIKLTLSLILWVNLRPTGYSIWSTPYGVAWTTTRGISTSQPRCSQKSTWRTPSRWSSGELEDVFRSTWTPAVLDYEELGGLSNPGIRDCACGILLVGYGMRHGPHPTSVVTTRSAVGLLVQ